MARAAANAAALAYAVTRDAAGKALADPSSPEGLRSACRTCVERHDQARALAAGVVRNLHGCALTNIIAGCTAAIAAAAVLPVGGDTQFYDQIQFGRDRSVLALRLAMLLVPSKFS